MAATLVASAEALATFTVHRHHRQRQPDIIGANSTNRAASQQSIDDSAAVQVQLQLIARHAHEFVHDLLDHLVEVGVPSSSPRFADNFMAAYSSNFGRTVEDAWARSHVQRHRVQHRRDKTMLLGARSTYLRGGLQTTTIAEYIIVGIHKSVFKFTADVNLLVAALAEVLDLCRAGQVTEAYSRLQVASFNWTVATDLPVLGEAFVSLPIEQDAFPPWAASWGRPFPDIPDQQAASSSSATWATEGAPANGESSSSTAAAKYGFDDHSRLPTVWEHTLDNDSDDARSNSSADDSTTASPELHRRQTSTNGTAPAAASSPLASSWSTEEERLIRFGFDQSLNSNRVSKSIENTKENLHHGFVVGLCRLKYINGNRRGEGGGGNGDAVAGAVDCKDLDNAIKKYQNGARDRVTQMKSKAPKDNDFDGIDIDDDAVIDLDEVMPIGPPRFASLSPTRLAFSTERRTESPPHAYAPPTAVSTQPTVCKKTQQTKTATVGRVFLEPNTTIEADIAAHVSINACAESHASFTGYLVRTGLVASTEDPDTIRLGTSKVARAITFFESQLAQSL